MAYLVSRFPHVSETFIVRELDGVIAAGGVQIDLLSLFPPVDATVHPAATKWVAPLRRGERLRGLAALFWWLTRRPLRLVSSIAVVCRAYCRRPALTLRALATLVIACQHARMLRAAPVDHIHAHYATYPALAAWMAHRLLGLPYSFTAHAHDLYVDQSMLSRKTADARFVVTISEFNRRFLLAHASARHEDVHVVHCGVDPRAYEFRPRAVPTSRPVRALCVASLQEYKGHTVLLQALAARPRLQRVELDLVGGGKLRSSLERLTAQLGIAERVRFFGSLTEQQVRERLEQADLFVLPSIVARDRQMEGLPVALMEALACGIPVVSTRLSGIPELVIDGETGLLAEPNNVHGLADALERALAEPDAALQRAIRGRALVERDFDIRDSGVRMAELFRGTLTAEHAASPVDPAGAIGTRSRRPRSSRP